MALMAYMTVKGQKQGILKGSVTQKGREGSIQVIAYHHNIVSPRDPQSGLPTGQRLHKPFTVLKVTDKATPPLYTALCTNENLTEVTINFWKPQIKAGTGTGSEVQYYTVKLTNANIASIAAMMPNVEDPAQQKFDMQEEVAFTYQKIEWTWTDGSILAMDDWEARV
ncbi:MAG TPA: Hcp family type VI secretion system effector [Terriglobales bacterium]|jgi:type VI secretion system secreted protein Hcp